MIEKVSKLGVCFPHTFSKKSKKDHMSITTCLLSKQKNYLFLKNIISGDKKLVFYNNAYSKRQWIDKDESPLPIQRQSFMGKKVCSVYGGIITVLFILSFETAIWYPMDIYTLNICNMCMRNLLRKCPVLIKAREETLCFSLIMQNHIQ